MKVNVLKKKTGKIIATFEPNPASGVKLEPQVSKEHKVEEVDVPQDYISRLDIVYKKKPTGQKRIK